LETEIAIVGAGIIGISTTFFLSKLNHDVTLFDRKNIGEEASGRNAGSLSMQNKPQAIIPLAIKGMKTWEELESEIGGLGLKQTGGLRVAETEVELERLHQDRKIQNKHDLGIEYLNPNQVKSLAPYLNHTLKGANYSPLDGYSDALSSGRMIAKEAEKNGARIVTHNPVTKIQIEEDQNKKILITTKNCEYECNWLVITAGVWAKEIVTQLGLYLPINLRINQMIVTPQLPRIVEHMITHVNGNLTIKQVENGTILIGGGWPGRGSVEKDEKMLLYDSIIGNIEIATRIVPELLKTTANRIWSGFDGRTEDQLPILGPIPGKEQVLLATSCFGGYTTGPYIGKLIAQIIDEGKPEISIESFSAKRYSS